MSYLLNRVKSTLGHLKSIRGLLIVTASFAAFGAVVTSDGTSQLLAVVSLAATAALLLLMSQRQADDHTSVASLKRQVRGLGTRKTTSAAAPVKAVERVGPNVETEREERVNRARTKILEVRGGLAFAEARFEPDPLPRSGELFQADKPAASVVVPCFNEARFLGATLESVRRQSFVNWECIIVDDASTDRSLSEARRFTKIDDRFRLTRHKANGGLSAARNTGLRMARGHYVTFLDSDDMLMRDSLLDRIEAFSDATPATVGTFSGMRLVPEDASLDSLPPHEKWPDPWFVDFVTAAGECPFNAHAPLLLTDAVRHVGGFDESMLDGAEDWDLWLRLLRRGYNLVPSKWKTAVYRQKHQSMAKEGARRHIHEAQRLISLAYNRDPSVIEDTAAPHPFPEPLPKYQEQLIHARRALQYAATSLVRGDRASAEAIISGAPGGIEPWMDHHFGLDAVIDTGFRRAFGLKTFELEDLADDLAPFRAELHNIIERSSSAVLPPRQPARAGTEWDTLFLPQNAVQAREMLEIADKLPADSFAFLSLERVSGSQGVQPIISVTTHPFFSLNEWVLSGHRHRKLVVAFPRDGAAEELISATVAGGGEVLELAMATDETMRVDASPDYGHGLARLDRVQATEWLLSDRPAPFVSSASKSGPAVLWHGATDPDPDDAYLVEEYPDTIFDAEDLERFKDIHRGERCVIIGNGPSLNQLDLTKLKDEYTIAVNGIFYAAEQMGYDPSYYVVEDTMVMRDNVDEIKAYRAGHKFFPSIYRDQVGEAANVTYFMMNRGYYAASSPSFCVPRFSTDASQRIYSGQSVTIINLQLAYYMGFKEVVLIGMDFSYTVPPDSKIDGAHILSMGDDPNHFHPDYFGKGKVWKDPKLDRVLANYQLAKLMYEADGRRIVNATAGGRLDLFDRVEFDHLFG